MPWFVTLALMIASYLLTALLTKTQKPVPAKLSEFQLPQAAEGTPQAVYFGDCWVPGWQVLWFGDLETRKVKSKGMK